MQLLPEDTPGKVGGPPGDAFEVVYGKVTDKVRRNMHAADPVLGELIRHARAPSDLSVPPSADASGWQFRQHCRFDPHCQALRSTSCAADILHSDACAFS